MINEIIVDTRNKWYGKLIEDKSYLNGLNIDEKKWTVSEGMLGKSFYKTYLKSHISKSYNDKIDNLTQNYGDNEWHIEYKCIGINNPKDGIAEYSMMWFLDIDDNSMEDGYHPIFIDNINTSSGYSLCRCGMDREDEEPDIWSFRDILQNINIQRRKTMTMFFQTNNLFGS